MTHIPVQATRGCPFNCSFCSVTRYLGREYRQREPDDVLSELSEIPGRYVAFVDDNFTLSPQRGRGSLKGQLSDSLPGGDFSRAQTVASVGMDDYI